MKLTTALVAACATATLAAPIRVNGTTTEPTATVSPLIEKIDGGNATKVALPFGTKHPGDRIHNLAVHKKGKKGAFFKHVEVSDKEGYIETPDGKIIKFLPEKYKGFMDIVRKISVKRREDPISLLDKRKEGHPAVELRGKDRGMVLMDDGAAISFPSNNSNPNSTDARPGHKLRVPPPTYGVQLPKNPQRRGRPEAEVRAGQRRPAGPAAEHTPFLFAPLTKREQGLKKIEERSSFLARSPLARRQDAEGHNSFSESIDELGDAIKGWGFKEDEEEEEDDDETLQRRKEGEVDEMLVHHKHGDRVVPPPE